MTLCFCGNQGAMDRKEKPEYVRVNTLVGGERHVHTRTWALRIFSFFCLCMFGVNFSMGFVQLAFQPVVRILHTDSSVALLCQDFATNSIRSTVFETASRNTAEFLLWHCLIDGGVLRCWGRGVRNYLHHYQLACLTPAIDGVWFCKVWHPGSLHYGLRPPIQDW